MINPLQNATCINDSQLSQLQLESNRQQQKDEVLVSQSIYEGDCVSVDKGGIGRVAVEILVHVDIRDSSIEVAGDDSSFTILRVLSLIILQYELPPTYPSHSPLLFKLSCHWLSPKQLSSLCASLDNLWNETSPEGVVFTWTEWLRSQALHHVNASKKLQLEPNEKSNEKG